MKNIIKTSQFISVTLDSGVVLVTGDTSSEMFKRIRDAKSDDDIIALIDTDYDNMDPLEKPVSADLRALVSGEISSDYLVIKGNSAYIPSISELTVPQDFAEQVLAAELEGKEDLLTTYLNFWTLISMNPDSNVRNNIFWFIRKWDIKISKSGLLIAYRNADYKKDGNFSKEFVDKVTNDYIKVRAQKQSPKNYFYADDDFKVLVSTKKGHIKPEDKETLADWYEAVTNTDSTPVFTDHHSHTFTIRIGETVSMPREKCCSDQNVSCSTGLHAGSAGWLTENYYGDTGLMVLINPAKVTSIPTVDDYGKLRCCEYLPVGIVHFDATGHIENMGIENGYEDQLLLEYAEDINNVDEDNYTLNMFHMYRIDRSRAIKNIMHIIEERGQ